MSAIITDRMAADIEGDFVVFRIGMRINRVWKPHKWLPTFLGMSKMLAELERTAENGLLSYDIKLGIRNQEVVQYWRSFDDLRAYAFDHEGKHFSSWTWFNREVGDSGDVGVWHETYLVAADRYETIYHNMPPYGLGKATDLVPAAGRRRTAAGRLGMTQGDDAPIDEEGNITVDIESIE